MCGAAEAAEAAAEGSGLDFFSILLVSGAAGGAAATARARVDAAVAVVEAVDDEGGEDATPEVEEFDPTLEGSASTKGTTDADTLA